jgi:hypothetical protein
VLRLRMTSCKSMIFATSKASPDSKWMPWELGYFDGLRRGLIGILPLLGDYESSFKGQEYIGLYPQVEKDTLGRLSVVNPERKQLPLNEFVAGSQAFRAYA